MIIQLRNLRLHLVHLSEMSQLVIHILTMSLYYQLKLHQNVEDKIFQCKNTKSHIKILNIMEENFPHGRKIMQSPK
jgi:hypothetical protein